jgi:hypothetical protein
MNKRLTAIAAAALLTLGSLAHAQQPYGEKNPGTGEVRKRRKPRPRPNSMR